MRYIIIKSEANTDGTITLCGAHKSIRKGGKNSIEWIDVKNAVSNTIDPDECDFLSFEDREDAQELLENAESDDLENIAVIGVDA